MANWLQQSGQSFKNAGWQVVSRGFDVADKLLQPMDTVGVPAALRGKTCPISLPDVYLRTSASLVVLGGAFVSGAVIAAPGAVLEKCGNAVANRQNKASRPEAFQAG